MTTTKKLLQEYYNGTYCVRIYDDGTKVRTAQQLFDNYIEFPESIDLKITNYCEHECSFCHESSNRYGKHSTLENIKAIINKLKLKPGVEIAIGGGNPLYYPSITEVLILLKEHSLIANITINECELGMTGIVSFLEAMQKAKLLYGIGISTNSHRGSQFDGFDKLKNIVFHCIIGNTTPFDVLRFDRPCNILLLGNKHYGRGEKYFKNDQPTIDFWKYHLPMVLSRKDIHISFDNLAIEQLELKKVLSTETWNKYYMGDDGEFSLYIDAVKMQWAKNSISKRKPL